MNWELSFAIGFGILLGTVLTRIFDWLLGVASGGKQP
jgi:hypothetical protein